MKEESDILISKYLNGNLSADERRQFNQWIEEKPEHRKIVADYQLLWSKAEGEGLSDQFDTEKALKRIKHKIPMFAHRYRWRNISNVAAVIMAVALITSSMIFYFGADQQQAANQNIVMQEVTTAFGTRSKFQLPDNSTVHLNSGSKLVFPSSFGKENRTVLLSGQAYFEVTKDTDKPFIVKTGAMQVKVLGTEFDLQAYENSDEISTTLVHGKIVLERVTGEQLTPLSELIPGERAIYNLDKQRLSINMEEETEKYTAWKEGRLVFFNDPISEVALKLGNWYNVEVILKNPKLKSYHFTATFTDEPIEQVLTLLSKSSPIHYTIQRAEKKTDNSYTKRIVTIY